MPSLKVGASITAVIEEEVETASRVKPVPTWRNEYFADRQFIGRMHHRVGGPVRSRDGYVGNHPQPAGPVPSQLLLSFNDDARLFFMAETLMLRFVPKLFSHFLNLLEDIGVAKIRSARSRRIGVENLANGRLSPPAF